jgi:uncharacterized protein YaaR (DUF327 family)
MKQARNGAVIAGIVLMGASVALLSRSEAEGPAASGAPVSPAAPNAAPAPFAPAAPETVRLLQENYVAIQKIVNANKESNPALKKVVDDIDAQGKSFRSAVDEKVISKDPEGAALIKKDRSLSASIDVLTRELKEKQQERIAVLQKRAEIMTKNAKNAEFQALSKANAEATRALNDQLMQVVGQISAEGRALVDERARLQAPAAKPVVPNAVSAK